MKTTNPRTTNQPTVLKTLAAAGLLLAHAARALAIDIPDTQPVAIDQPQINVLLQDPGGPVPDPINTITGFLDTGASGVLISNETASAIGLDTKLVLDGSNNPVTFSDVGVAGSDNFFVSKPQNLLVGAFPTAGPPFTQTFNSLHLQVGPQPPPSDPSLQGLDVFGTPIMNGKVVVMDPTPLKDLSDNMHTYIYNPGTPFHAGTAATDPGIPTTNLHVALSQASFDRFTQVTPSGFPGPDFSHNPFIGPNPVALLDPHPPADNTPPVGLDLNGLHTTGSFLLDTGSVTSFISTQLAGNLHVRYVAGTFGGTNPQLETFDPLHPSAPGTPIANQFTLAVGGIGGTVTEAGFFLDDLVIHTKEGGLNDANVNNLHFLHEPVLVNDVSVMDPNTHQVLTLDGVFGMNNLVSSVMLNPDLSFGASADGAFNWITYDEPNSTLGLDIANVPEPSSLVLLATAAAALAGYRMRRGKRKSTINRQL